MACQACASRSPLTSPTQPARITFFLQVFFDACFDESASIRRQAAVSLSALFRGRPDLEAFQHAWLGGALPLVRPGTLITLIRRPSHRSSVTPALRLGA